jgi:galactofuranose transport system ATP-binding protein
MADGHLLSMRGIDKRFAGVSALAQASLDVAAGEVHALVGQNGAGKSTLIKVLTGYHRRDAGEVLFQGKPFEVSSPQQAQASGISTIYQEINLVPLRSITENICLGREKRRFAWFGWNAMHQEAERLLGRFNVNVDVRRPLMEFSTATQQMVAIARAIGFSARLVIMDEPTSSLDEQEVEVLFKVIRQLKAEGVSVVYVSHKLDELYEVCDRVTIMRDGHTVRTAQMSEINKLELVSQMLGRDVSKAQGHATSFRKHAHNAEGKTVFEAVSIASRQAVRDVSFGLRSGEIAGFAGLLGAGRTETAHVVFGSDRPRGGSMSLRDQPYAPGHPRDAINAGLGFVTEDRKLEGIVPELSVAENLTLALLPRISSRGVVSEKRQREIAERFIKDLAIKCSGPGQKIRELSGGNQQKVMLARWLAMSPEILILDEPTRGIDVGAKGEIQRLIRSLAEDGLAVLMISSELEEITEGADRVFVLREGRTVAELSGADITEANILAVMAQGHISHEGNRQ